MSGNNNSKIHILLSEGSSTNVREIISALGPLGYSLEICDPNPICMGRFSRYIRKVYPCPVSGADPLGYLKCIMRLLKQERYDVLFPANEQAFLFAWARDFLTPLAGLAVADFSSFNRVQTKSAFMQLLDEIQLPHPMTRLAENWHEIEQVSNSFSMPFYIKTLHGTASTGVWRIERKEDLVKLKTTLAGQNLLNGQTKFLVQAVASGSFEQSHAIFDRGSLLALHCTRRLKEGAQGGAALKVGVNRPVVRNHFEKIGRVLEWHGSLSVDYFWDETRDQPSYIDANPRITEPMNAMVNGVNLADLQVRLSLGETLSPRLSPQAGLKSHSTLQVMLGKTKRGHSRLGMLEDMLQVVFKRGIYQGSQEGMTPIGRDLPSILPLFYVFATLLIDPGKQDRDVLKTISNYSLGTAIPMLSALQAQDFIC